MKITVNSSKNFKHTPLNIDVEISADHPFLHPELYNKLVAASDLTNYNLPTNPVITKDRARVTQWMIDDFESFVEMVASLCEDNYNLECTFSYRNKENSYYYNYLAKDDVGNIIARFRMRLRISNHGPKSTSQQKRNKRNELLSEKLHELLSEKEIRKLRKYPLIITVNDELYDSYVEAFEDIDQMLEHAVSVMKGKNST